MTANQPWLRRGSLGMGVTILLAVVLVASSSPPRYRREAPQNDVRVNETSSTTEVPKVDHPEKAQPPSSTSEVPQVDDPKKDQASLDSTIIASTTPPGSSQGPPVGAQADIPPHQGAVPKPVKPKPLFSTAPLMVDPETNLPVTAASPPLSQDKDKVQSNGSIPKPTARIQDLQQQQERHQGDQGMPILNSFAAALAEEENNNNNDDNSSPPIATEEPPVFRTHQDLMDLLSFAASFGFNDDSKQGAVGDAHKGGQGDQATTITPITHDTPLPEAPVGRSMVEDDHSPLVSKVKVQDQQGTCHPRDKDCNIKKSGKIDRVMEIDASLDIGGVNPPGSPTSPGSGSTTPATTSTADEGLFGIFKRLWWF